MVKLYTYFTDSPESSFKATPKPFIIERTIESAGTSANVPITVGIAKGGDEGVRVAYKDGPQMHYIMATVRDDHPDNITYDCTGGVHLSFNKCQKDVCYTLRTPQIPYQSGRLSVPYKPIRLDNTKLDRIERLSFSQECLTKLYSLEKHIQLYESDYAIDITRRLPELKKEYKATYETCLDNWQ
jgi:hypothetical protein